jgi:hypothetical protein
MTTYTATVGNRNIDSFGGKTGNDTYIMDGATLIVDQHSRYGVNQTTSSTMGNITLSATLGAQFSLIVAESG